MKIPKTRRTYCKFCKRYTQHKITESKQRTFGSVHTQSYGSKKRARKRGRMNIGSKGRYSRPPISKWKMTGKKQSKKTDFRLECKECKRSKPQKQGFRARRIEFKQ